VLGAVLVLVWQAPTLIRGSSTVDAGRSTQTDKSESPPLTDFRNIAAESGLIRSFPNGGVESKTYIVETTGSGIAFLDYDNDGFLDIFVVSGPAEATGSITTIRKGTLLTSPGKWAWNTLVGARSLRGRLRQ